MSGEIQLNPIPLPIIGLELNSAMQYINLELSFVSGHGMLLKEVQCNVWTFEGFSSLVCKKPCRVSSLTSKHEAIPTTVGYYYMVPLR